MKRSIIIITLFLFIIIAACTFLSEPKPTVIPLTVTQTAPVEKVILIPLDSRPPCTQFVEKLANLQKYEILMPPAEILDHYKEPANKQAIRDWLKTNAKNASAAIISTDMLIHGGLLASRFPDKKTEDKEAALALLKELHTEYPALSIYAFTIIPRLLIADNVPNAPRYKFNMYQYTSIKDQLALFENPKDLKKLDEVKQKLPSELIDQYYTLYESQYLLSQQLIDMTEQGILQTLVIGQDDSHPFGLPNQFTTKIEHYAKNKPVQDKVFVTRGADEIATVLLGRIVNKQYNYRPRIFVQYSTPEASSTIMPFMPHSTLQTVNEKIHLVGGIQVDSPTKADYILYVHIGDRLSPIKRERIAREVNHLLESGFRVALVDMTQNSKVSEMLLPALLDINSNLPELFAYAGWNTASNAIGTAVSQASIYYNALMYAPPSDTLRIFKENLEFTSARFLDDCYYEKDLEPQLKKHLTTSNIDPYNLAWFYPDTNNYIQKKMTEKGQFLFARGLATKPVILYTEKGYQNIVITHFWTGFNLPWKELLRLKQKQPPL